jgi:hypothetical protein
MQNKQTCGIKMPRCEDYYLPCLGELSTMNQIQEIIQMKCLLKGYL